MSELEPRTSEYFREVGGIVVEALRDRTVGRVLDHRHVCIGHHGHEADRRILNIDRLVFFLDVDGVVDLRPCGRVSELPVVVEQQVEVAVVPLGGVGGPGTFNTGADGIAPHTTSGVVHPTEALLLNVSTFRGRAEVTGVTITVSLTHGVTTGGESNSLFVIHCHAGKGFTNLLSSLERVRVTVNTFRVHIDQTHLDCSQRVLHGGRVFQVAIARVRRRKPFLLRTPVDVELGVPDVFTAETKAEGLQTHGFVGHVSGEDEQVSPAELVSILALDGPEQTTCLVQVHVVRPGVQRRETEVSVTSTTATIGGAVGTGRVPCHTDHETAVVTPVSGPP